MDTMKHLNENERGMVECFVNLYTEMERRKAAYDAAREYVEQQKRELEAMFEPEELSDILNRNSVNFVDESSLIVLTNLPTKLKNLLLRNNYATMGEVAEAYRSSPIGFMMLKGMGRESFKTLTEELYRSGLIW